MLFVDSAYEGIKTPSQVATLIATAERAHANALVIQVRRYGESYYLAGSEPIATDIAAGFDPLAAVLAAAHAKGLEVHANLMVLDAWPNWGGSLPSNHVLAKHGAGSSDEWITRTYTGQATSGSIQDYWLDPGHPSVGPYLAGVVTDLLTRYPDVDGLQLDAVYIPGLAFGFNQRSVERFKVAYNRTTVPLPSDASWQQWRRDQVTDLVKQLVQAAHATAPKVRVSAAVLAGGESPNNTPAGWQGTEIYTSAAQDWKSWAESGLIDTVMPLLYANEPTYTSYFNAWLSWMTSTVNGEIVVGIGASLNTASINADQVARVQAAGALGSMVLSYARSSVSTTERTTLATFDALASGPWKLPVDLPLLERDGYGVMVGTVEGANLPTSLAGLPVVIKGPTLQSTATDASGSFRAELLLPGTYNIEVRVTTNRTLYADAYVVSGGVAYAENWRETPPTVTPVVTVTPTLTPTVTPTVAPTPVLLQKVYLPLARSSR